jgi:protein MAK16
LKAAQLDRAIEKELLDRLKQATTEGSEIFNYPEQQYTKVLNKAASKFKSKGEKDAQLEDPDEEEEEYEDEVSFVPSL